MRCEHCGSEAAFGLDVIVRGRARRFDRLECALAALGRACAACGRGILGVAAPSAAGPCCSEECAALAEALAPALAAPA
jgi:hypothetical protein